MYSASEEILNLSGLTCFLSWSSVNGCQELTLHPVQLNLTSGSPEPASAMVFLLFLDSRHPWGSPRDRDVWVRWTVWVAPRTGSGSGVGDCASSSSVSCRGGEERTVSDHQTIVLRPQQYCHCSTSWDLLDTCWNNASSVFTVTCSGMEQPTNKQTNQLFVCGGMMLHPALAVGSQQRRPLFGQNKRPVTGILGDGCDIFWGRTWWKKFEEHCTRLNYLVPPRAATAVKDSQV